MKELSDVQIEKLYGYANGEKSDILNNGQWGQNGSTIVCCCSNCGDYSRATLSDVADDLPTEYQGLKTLSDADDVEAIMDKDSPYCLINRRQKTVRVDIMGPDHSPIISFESDSMGALRKHVIDAIKDKISPEHAGYIGYEIMRALSDVDYIQD